MDRNARFDPTFLIGFNELRGRNLYNTALVAHKPICRRSGADW